MNDSTRRHVSALRNCAAFALALAAVGFSISSALPSLPVAEISGKLAHLRAHAGEIDTVFIGSSRIYRAFDPRAFDRELTSLGVASRSFNLGVDGMRPPESLYVIRELLKLRLPLRRVIIELGDIQPKVNAANLGSARYVHWHDARHTWLVLQHIARARRPAGERLAQALVHAGCFIVRTSNIGRGPEWLGALLRGRERPPAMPLASLERGGFAAQPGPPISGKARANFESAVAVVKKIGLGRTPVPPLLAAALREVVAEIRAAGAQPVFVISPTVVGRENLVGLREAGLDVPVIAFTDPHRHPAIFHAENHADEQHLNAAGAEAFTRALAGEVAALER